MSNEIARYSAELERTRQRMREVEQGSLVRAAPLGLKAARVLPKRVDVPRHCVPTRKPWAAIYLLQPSGTYRYAGSIQITDRLLSTTYAEQGVPFVLDGRFVRQEECPWCGVWGMLFNCRECGLVCSGLSNGRIYRCLCGWEGVPWRSPYPAMKGFGHAGD